MGFDSIYAHSPKSGADAPIYFVDVISKYLYDDGMTPQVQRWLDMADYDLDVAAFCFTHGVYIYCVFFCHQALEKLLKAIIM